MLISEYNTGKDCTRTPGLIRWRGECTLIEVKAGTGNAKSAKTILKHPEKYHVGQCIKLGDYNVGRNGRILTLPLYMGFLLNEV